MHAILILATEYNSVLERMIHLMDDDRNDIYIHLDSKFSAAPKEILTKKSRVYLEKRDDLRWGDVSIVAKEIEMIERCLANHPYTHIHLVSGSDLPVKSPNYIHRFCEKNKGVEFVSFATPLPGELYEKAGKYHLFPRFFRNCPMVLRIVRSFFLKLQTVCHLKREDTDMIRKGPQWFTITSQFGQFVIENKLWVLKRFKNTFCPDELFMQTLLSHSAFSDKVYYAEDEWRGCLRYVKWENNVIAQLSRDDLAYAFNSDSIFFVRKVTADELSLLETYDEMYNRLYTN